MAVRELPPPGIAGGSYLVRELEPCSHFGKTPLHGFDFGTSDSACGGM